MSYPVKSFLILIQIILVKLKPFSVFTAWISELYSVFNGVSDFVELDYCFQTLGKCFLNIRAIHHVMAVDTAQFKFNLRCKYFFHHFLKPEQQYTPSSPCL